MLYVFTGKGKGKTTASLGMSLRALGAGKRVLFVQFLKSGVTSEFELLKDYKNFIFESFGREGFFLPQKKLEENPELKKKASTLQDIDKKKALEGLNWVKKKLAGEHFDLIILDEVNIALSFGLLEISDILDIILSYEHKVFVLTGREAPNKIIENADLVTNCKEVKHPYQKGVEAQEGIEY